MQESITDQLEGFVKRLKLWAESSDSVCIDGGLADENPDYLNVRFAPSSENHFDEFLKTLAKLRPSAVLIEQGRFTDEEWQDFAEKLDGEGRVDALEFKKYIGQVAIVAIVAIVEHPKLLLRHLATTSWYDDVVSDDDDDANSIVDTEWAGLSPKQEIELARKIVADQRFAKAKNRATRTFLVQTILEEEDLDPPTVRRIADVAKAILETEQ